MKDLKYLEAWICLFGNKTPRDVWVMLFREKFQFSEDEKADRQWEAWQLLFGKFLSQKEAALEVRYNWM